MGKTAKAIPLAPLERDVEPPLRKLTFVRARCASRPASSFAPAPRASTADAARRHASRFRAGAVSSRELTRPPPSSPTPSPSPRRRRADPPLISEHAMKQMIVLNAGASAPGSAAASRATRGRSSSDDDERDARSRRGVAVADSLYPRDAIRMDWPAVRKVGAGLANLGNTCFMNAVMQCLTHTPPLASFCLAGEHRRYKTAASGFNAIFEMGEHVTRALNAPGRAIAPVAFVKNLRALSKTFRKGRQEDAHEFTRCLLDAMHKRCVESARPKPPEGSPRSETTFVWQVFGGRLRSRVSCKTCGRKSDTFDSFMDLSLDVARSKSVTHALKSYVATEVLDGANKYKCEMGGGKPHMSRATKQFTVDVAPLVLTVQLKRFEYVPFGRGKLNQFVEYPLELDLSSAMSDAAKGAGGKERYALFGVLVHSGGSMHSGHYYCYVKGATGHWYEMDDEGVTQCGESVALRQRAYLLFYAKIGTGLDGAGAAAKAAKAAAKEANAKAAAKKEKEREREREMEMEMERRKEMAAEAKAREAEKVAKAKAKKAKKEAEATAIRDAAMKEAAAKEARRAKAARRSEREDAARAAARDSDPHQDSDSDPAPVVKIGKRRRPSRFEETEEDAPTSPTGSERSLGSFKSPLRHGGKLLSSRDSARLRLMSKRLMLRAEAAASSAGRRGDGKTSPMKTRAARRAAAASASASVSAASASAKSTKPRRTDSVEDPPPTRLGDESPPRRKAASSSSAPPADGKAVKQWLNRSARASNVVGRGGGGGWDDADDAAGDVKPREAKPRASSKTQEKAGRGGFKRRRAYDDLDAEYDRGKVSKHARRKAEGGGGSKRSAPRSAGGAARNPFQSAAKLKRER